MPECQNCGEFVTERYVRVFVPEGVDEPRCCPGCPDKVRDGRTGRPRLKTTEYKHEELEDARQ